ncbi:MULTISPECIES: hypothetical protein [unclassified Mesorhizobium]|uniref:hypothetical protein n=1 Tax=unclassified Mesorhizobium TaxID=325217 RepID=UPI000FCC4A37|nr:MULTISPECIES: hypothetical protein [unclassified Mesorhizobium]RUV26488.1 hypothetical protein EOA91_04410 [Mesorhizobium sp. M1A.F.Ca.IN.022.04.1.1]RWG30893.1 MAG: hypothetical protein EOQ60_17690 [Mesorhizobium sp.]
MLIVKNESIAFGLEEQPEKALHQPTPAELKRRDERARLGYTTDPWSKYDQFPSGRLAIVIHANPYSGLRRTYSDGKTQTLESMLPDILAGFVGHAAYISERRRESDERERRQREAEARRQREEAFNSRETRRMEFVDAVHEQLTQRDKLTAVLSHLENATSEDAARVSAMTTWVRQRLKQIDALINPHFLNISARSSKVDFTEPDPEQEAEGGSYYYSPPSASNSGLSTKQRGWPPRTRCWSGKRPWACQLRKPSGNRPLGLADTKPRLSAIRIRGFVSRRRLAVCQMRHLLTVTTLNGIFSNWPMV